MEAELVTKLLALNGGAGLLAVGLLIALKAIWNKYQEALQQFNAVQTIRITEHADMVKTLAENNRLMGEITEVLK